MLRWRRCSAGLTLSLGGSYQHTLPPRPSPAPTCTHARADIRLLLLYRARPPWRRFIRQHTAMRNMTATRAGVMYASPRHRRRHGHHLLWHNNTCPRRQRAHTQPRARNSRSRSKHLPHPPLHDVRWTDAITNVAGDAKATTLLRAIYTPTRTRIARTSR